jgi:hypothetical protein
MIAHDWDDKAKWLRSIDRLTHQIVPALPSLVARSFSSGISPLACAQGGDEEGLL